MVWCCFWGWNLTLCCHGTTNLCGSHSLRDVSQPWSHFSQKLCGDPAKLMLLRRWGGRERERDKTTWFFFFVSSLDCLNKQRSYTGYRSALWRGTFTADSKRSAPRTWSVSSRDSTKTLLPSPHSWTRPWTRCIISESLSYRSLSTSLYTRIRMCISVTFIHSFYIIILTLFF